MFPVYIPRRQIHKHDLSNTLLEEQTFDIRLIELIVQTTLSYTRFQGLPLKIKEPFVYTKMSQLLLSNEKRKPSL